MRKKRHQILSLLRTSSPFRSILSFGPMSPVNSRCTRTVVSRQMCRGMTLVIRGQKLRIFLPACSIARVILSIPGQ